MTNKVLNKLKQLVILKINNKKLQIINIYNSWNILMKIYNYKMKLLKNNKIYKLKIVNQQLLNIIK